MGHPRTRAHPAFAHGGLGWGTRAKDKAKVKINYPTSANGGQIWGTLGPSDPRTLAPAHAGEKAGSVLGSNLPPRRGMAQ
jgi:hypothetical protein